MAQQSARRDQENQGFPLCFEHAVGDLDRIRELPYRPAGFERPHQQAGQMAASDYVSEIPENHSCAEGGVHRWKAEVEIKMAKRRLSKISHRSQTTGRSEASDLRKIIRVVLNEIQGESMSIERRTKLLDGLMEGQPGLRRSE